MSGHSRWAGIKHRKGAQDAKRGRVFTKLIREITIAAREGGGNPEHNPRLRKAIDDARADNMPAENVKRAIQRGTGELPGVVYEEVVYEGYGPAGVAVIVEATTDNKNRTTSEIRRLFSEYGGNLGESGCVSWMFKKKGYLAVEKNKIGEDELISIALDAGAEDVRTDDEDLYEVITLPEEYEKVKKILEEKKIPLSSAEITFFPQTYIKLDEKKAETMLALMNALEEHEDVKNVYANFDIPKAVMEKVVSVS
ncbi:MAG TPA: YebC/PmpR family DNA-binding transcriptional regulator [Elusimicrobia bacterium]|nr:YebC/PmpR family DNA-binding transcriptional regulator [Elusimicrobiota bacterium]